MQLANSTRSKLKTTAQLFSSALLLLLTTTLFAQDNSPYSRFGLGDLVPNTNIVNRSMAGISAAHTDVLSVNFNNPASYSSFKAYQEANSKKLASGRVLLDAGISIDNRTLRSPNQVQKFATSYANFSYLQVGVPLRRNWGLSFGLRPVSRISYKIRRTELLSNPTNGAPIDSAYTEFTGEGGTFLPSIGSGFAIKNLSLGVNIGYLFGRKQYSTTRSFLNDTVAYYSSNHSTESNFGDLFYNAGLQYRINFSSKTHLTLGATGNWEQNIKATQNSLRETFTRNADGGHVQIDSVFEQESARGEIIYPASYTAGFVLERLEEKGNGWLIGADYVKTKWNDYRFFNTIDSVQDNWQVRIGGQFRPEPSTNYFSNVAYRAGFSFGPDYVKVGQNLPQYGITFGLGLPIANFNRLSPGQFTVINVGMEYMKRGNNTNILKENIFRLTLGLNFSDLWFNKRKYD